jgi:hypothetical protein
LSHADTAAIARPPATRAIDLRTKVDVEKWVQELIRARYTMSGIIAKSPASVAFQVLHAQHYATYHRKL